MKIGDLAKVTGCSIQTIRFYERKGLLAKPRRTEANYRTYDNVALEELTFIKQCRSLDISMKEIETLLQNKNNPDQSCASVNALIDEHIIQVNEKISELSQLKMTLEKMSKSCGTDKTIKECGILSELTS
ncbi:Cd(II)/Pb(II)-responsive transcriptional regulator [Aliiglaciecola sp. M165]|uniref:Cd(II)/Pb(II)-responsive transcriptional regulator n=1 Tax=Aliiglaciecola sp. M165 TaxID=2593649 RepID=UPI0011811A9A|nr:Cd(II)/Pb(II)-responsive transcriptional regulator [Aliiglaciecola sp. M165]TRY33971.1 Cd(II)/Pb(II)-responsive transcriptional regulator [Aliiglaciecola sp. M165]